MRALLAACKGATEPVLNTYEQLLSNGAILPSPNLRLRFLRSVLVVLREWAMSVFAQRMGTSATGASLILGGTFSLGQTTAVNRGVRDKINNAANRLISFCFVLVAYISNVVQLSNCCFFGMQNLNIMTVLSIYNLWNPYWSIYDLPPKILHQSSHYLVSTLK